MRRQIGEKSLSIWLEFLSIADQHDGQVPGQYDLLIRSIAGSCQSTVTKVTAVYDWGISQVWLKSEPTLHVVKYWNYHKRTEPEKDPGPLPPDQSDPIRSDPKIKNAPEPTSSAPSADSKNKKELDPRIKKWSDQVYAIDSKKYERLIAWVKSAEQTYDARVIASALERFVPYAAAVGANWWGYIDKILDKEEVKFNASVTEINSNGHKKDSAELASNMFGGSGMGAAKGRPAS